MEEGMSLAGGIGSVAHRQMESADGVSRGSAYPSVAGIAVIYYPNPFLLARLIGSVLPQVDRLFIVDNTPVWDHKLPEALAQAPNKIEYLANGFNAGVASAQNAGLRKALEMGYTHVMLLDQDSALPDGAVEGLLAAEASLIRAGRKVSAVGPLSIDEKSGRRSQSVRTSRIGVRRCEVPATIKEPVETDFVISSGSLIRSDVLGRVGLMQDELFIDWVDAEWNYRAKGLGFSAFIVPTVVMRHSLGDATEVVCGRQVCVHSPMRDCYIVRNATYLLQNPRMNWKWRLTMLFYIPQYILVHSWVARKRFTSLVRMLHAVRDGMMRRMTPYSLS